MARKRKDSEVASEVSEDAKVDDKAKDDVAEAVVPAPAVEGDEDFSPEDEARYALPMAPIVRIMKSELDRDKMIRRRVKEEMNLWLEKLCKRVAKRMNQSEYTVVEIADLRTAIEPYEMIDDVEGERQRIVATLEKIKQDCDSLIRDVNRKFIAPDAVQGPPPAE